MTIIAVLAITLLLILGAIVTPYSIVFAKKHSNTGNNNDDGNTKGGNDKNSNPGDSNNNNGGDNQQPPDNQQAPPPDETTPQPVEDQNKVVEPIVPPPDQSPSTETVDCKANPTNPSCAPIAKKTLASPLVDCTLTPNDPSCPPKEKKLPVDCIANPTDPLCPPPKEQKAAQALVPAVITPKLKGPDNRCLFFPELPQCAPDKDGKCRADFFMNGDGQCVPNKKCPPGFENHDNDESGTCWPKNKYSPSIVCPPGVKPPHCVTICHPGQHPNQFFLCVKNNVIVVHKTVKKVVHITTNNDQNSMVTRNTKITDQLTVGQAIDGCKDLTKKSPDNALKKSCNIMMTAAFNYCMTHTKLWQTDSNICSDNLYLNNVQRYIAENVNIKLFPATIYNIRP